MYSAFLVKVDISLCGFTQRRCARIHVVHTQQELTVECEFPSSHSSTLLTVYAYATPNSAPQTVPVKTWTKL